MGLQSAFPKNMFHYVWFFVGYQSFSVMYQVPGLARTHPNCWCHDVQLCLSRGEDPAASSTRHEWGGRRAGGTVLDDRFALLSRIRWLGRWDEKWTNSHGVSSVQGARLWHGVVSISTLSNPDFAFSVILCIQYDQVERRSVQVRR